MNEEKLNKLLDTLSSIDSSLADIAKSLDGLNKDFASCISVNQNSYALSITGDVTAFHAEAY